MSFELHLRTREQGTVLECRGQLVAGSELDSLRIALESLMRFEKRVVLNLGGLQSIDAAGLGVLAAAAEAARQRGCMVVLCGLNKRLNKLLRLTRLDSVLLQSESEIAALTVTRTAAA